MIFCVVLSHNRLQPFVGRTAGTCRSKSYQHMAYNPSVCYSESIHSEPLYRKTVRPVYPVEAAGIVAAQGYGGQHGCTTRYVIVNEREPRKKLLRSATRVPRHYLIEEPAEILELYPYNAKCFAPRKPYYQTPPHGPQPSHLGQEDKEDGKCRRKPQQHWSLSELHHSPDFYIGDHIKDHVFTVKGSHNIPGSSGENEEEDGEGDPHRAGLKSRFHTSVKAGDPLLVHRIHQSPGRTRYKEKPRTRAKLETPQTESDSASLASSSDQQNGSTDQYIQVIHNKSETHPAKVAKKRSKTSFQLNVTESLDLVSSNVWSLY